MKRQMPLYLYFILSAENIVDSYILILDVVYLLIYT